jgi:hypothetical protein
MIKIWFSVETNHCMSWCCTTCLLSCDVQVCSTEIDGNGEGVRVRVNGLGAVKNERGGLDLGTEWWRTDRGWLCL